MISFFTRNKSTINSVIIPDYGWEKEKDSKEAIQWINPEQSLAVSINYFSKKPDLPSSTSIDMLRVFYRNQITEANGGLIKVDFCELNGFKGVETIFKIPQSNNSLAYLASLTIPFSNCSYVVKVQARETGIPGVREAVISDRFLKKGSVSTKDGNLENWSNDPYNANFIDGTLMNKSEAPIYDIEFLSHPLTEARKMIAELKKNIKFMPELDKLKEFNK
jgi:hypothetical protein